MASKTSGGKESITAFAHPPYYEPLAAHHDRASFDCGEKSLTSFLQQRVRQNADRNLGVTHVAVPERGSSQILGYYTLLVRSVESQSFAEAKKLPPGEIGVVLLARLAVSREAQGQRLGTQMLLWAMVQTERVTRVGNPRSGDTSSARGSQSLVSRAGLRF